MKMERYFFFIIYYYYYCVFFYLHSRIFARASSRKCYFFEIARKSIWKYRWCILNYLFKKIFFCVKNGRKITIITFFFLLLIFEWIEFLSNKKRSFHLKEMIGLHMRYSAEFHKKSFNNAWIVHCWKSLLIGYQYSIWRQ